MRYLVDRLKEPGTLRSLAVVLFALLGLAPDDPRLEAIIQLSILALGTLSAVMPEKSAKAAEVLQQSVETAKDITADARATAASAERLVGKAQAVVSDAEGALRSKLGVAGVPLPGAARFTDCSNGPLGEPGR